ncbi:structural protein [Roseovarius sp. 217 phage 1]|uniref:Structural protein n=1 Tax=Roseovarius sp. 217 phage 1 TaxID=874471 RepID=E3PZ75_9CAUD|nr:structural protein [Roseovarius sp. 217 phage 1]
MRYGLIASVLSSIPKGATFQYRFWRVWGINNHHASSNYLTAGEIEFYANDNTTDLTIGTSGAIASSVLSATYIPEHAFDNDPTNTRWASNNTTPAGIGWDFGEGNEVQLTGLSITPGQIPTETPREFYLQYSEDGVTWFDYAYFETAAPTTAVKQIFTFPLTSDIEVQDFSANLVYGGGGYPGIILNDLSANIVYGGP